MLHTLIKGAALAVAILSFQPATAQTLFRPVAVVNDSAITGFDLAQRAQMLVAMGFSSASPDALRAEALDQLVEDRLKIQAGKQLGFSPTPTIVEAGIEQLAQRANLSTAEFQVLMNSRGVTDLAVQDLAAAEIIWLEVVRARFANRVEPGEAEIDAELGITQERAAFDYRVQELGLPLNEENRTEQQTRALAEELYATLNNGADFNAAVATYSRAPSAAQGGNLGWLSTERMPPELLRALSELQPGQVSRPLAVAGGLSLIKLLETRSTGATLSSSPEAREGVRSRLINQRSNRLSEGLLQEMRRDALIEVR